MLPGFTLFIKLINFSSEKVARVLEIRRIGTGVSQMLSWLLFKTHISAEIPRLRIVSANVIVTFPRPPARVGHISATSTELFFEGLFICHILTGLLDMPSDKPDSKIYIEFVGQHTAGKTTVIHDIVDRGLLEPKKAIYPQKIKKSRIHFFLKLPQLFFTNIFDLIFIISFFLRNTNYTWTNYHSSGRHMWKMVILHPYYSKFDFDIWMKDDLLHLLPRIEFRENVDVYFAFKKFFNRFSHLYSGLIYIELPYQKMKSRFDIRFKNRSSMRRANRAVVYERAYKQNFILKRILVEQSKVPILLLDGLSDVETKSAQVVRFISEKIYEKA